VARLARVVLDLLAHPPDVHSHRPGVEAFVVAPDPAHDLIPGEHATGVARDEPQEVELLGRKPDLDAALADLPRAGVHRQIADLEPLDRRRGRARTPEHGLDPSDQLPRRERLGDVVVGAELETHDAVGFLAERGQHDHRPPPRRTDPAHDRQAVDAREHEIEDDEVRLGRFDDGPRPAAVLGLERLEALALEVADDHVPGRRVVVDDQHGLRHVHRGYPLARVSGSRCGARRDAAPARCIPRA
jgi:hypothetical protein